MTVWVLGQGAASTCPRCSATRWSPPATRSCSSRWSSTARADLTKLNFISLALALVLGTAGLPHVLMRFYTVPTAKEARRSVVWAIWLIGLFYLFTLVLGFGAMASSARRRSSPRPAA